MVQMSANCQALKSTDLGLITAMLPRGKGDGDPGGQGDGVRVGKKTKAEEGQQ